MGVPTVASPAPIFTDTITHEANGYLADAADWPDVLLGALADEKSRKAVAKQALHHVGAHYTRATVAPKITEVLAKLGS